MPKERFGEIGVLILFINPGGNHGVRKFHSSLRYLSEDTENSGPQVKIVELPKCVLWFARRFCFYYKLALNYKGLHQKRFKL